MNRQFYIGMIASFALGFAIGANFVAWPDHYALNAGKQVAMALVQTQSDRDQAYGRLDECEGILKAHGWEDGK